MRLVQQNHEVPEDPEPLEDLEVLEVLEVPEDLVFLEVPEDLELLDYLNPEDPADLEHLVSPVIT